MKAVLFALLASLASAKTPEPPPEIIDPSRGNASAYRQLLVDALRSADRIEVTEHSNRFDLTEPHGNRFIGPYFIYASHTLSDEERARLVKAVENVDPEFSLAPMCLFSPHHAIDFYVGTRRESRMEICFSCGDLVWDAVYAEYPRALLGVFDSLMKESGLTPEQNWPHKAHDVLIEQRAGGIQSLPPPDPMHYNGF